MSHVSGPETLIKTSLCEGRQQVCDGCDRRSRPLRLQHWCYENFLNSRNLRTAQDVRKQLREICVRLDLSINSCGRETTPIGWGTRTSRVSGTVLTSGPVFAYALVCKFSQLPCWQTTCEYRNSTYRVTWELRIIIRKLARTRKRALVMYFAVNDLLHDFRTKFVLHLYVFLRII